MKLLILGHSGCLGEVLLRQLEYLGNKHVIGLSRSSVSGLGLSKVRPGEVFSSLGDGRLRDMVRNENVTHVVNCVGSPDPDYCEANQWEAYCSNTAFVYDLVRELRDLNVCVIHLSSMYVFGLGGEEGGFYEEDERVPVNFYGMSKKIGEDILLNSKVDNIIIRLPMMIGDERKRGRFYEKVEKLLSESFDGARFLPVSKEVKYPTLVKDLALFIDRVSLKRTGVFNFSSSEALLQEELVFRLFKREFVREKLLFKLRETSGQARRVENLRLLSRKEEVLNFKFTKV